MNSKNSISYLNQEEVTPLLESSFQEALEESGLKSFPIFKGTKTLVLCNQNKESLAVLCYRELTEELYEIDFIATKKSLRQSGLASGLLQSLTAQSYWLEVSESNSKAFKFYLKNGFKEVGRRKSYYQDGSDAISMKK